MLILSYSMMLQYFIHKNALKILIGKNTSVKNNYVMVLNILIANCYRQK